MTAFEVDQPRASVDRRAVADRLQRVRPGKAIRADAAAILAEALAGGRAEVARRLTDEPGNGRAAAQATAFLHDQLMRLAWDFVGEQILDAPLSEPVALVGLGGTGRGEMAPYSDVDLMFLTAKARARTRSAPPKQCFTCCGT